MNKHKKLAIFIAPFLLIAGYIIADYVVEQQANENQVFALTLQGQCQLSQACLLTSNELQINIYQEGSRTIVNANYALTDAVLFEVNEQVTAYQLTPENNAFYWQTDVAFNTNKKERLTMRLIAKIKGASYISEFSATMK